MAIKKGQGKPNDRFSLSFSLEAKPIVCKTCGGRRDIAVFYDGIKDKEVTGITLDGTPLCECKE